MVMEGEGRIGEYVGGYSDWVRQRPVPPASAAQVARASATANATAVPAAPAQLAVPAAESAPRRKLSYKDARELEQLPARIESLETELAGLTGSMADPAFYQQDAGAVAAHTRRMSDAQRELDLAYARWAELDA
jgi:ABC transport system ATP-binding/permease protein